MWISRKKANTCPVCEGALVPFRTVDKIAFYRCGACGSFAADPAFLARVDAGETIRPYDKTYWQNELAAARDRSFGPALARVAEVLLYARRPVRRFVDIGSGPGYLLDALDYYLPTSKDVFWGVEMFPPQTYTNNANFVIGSLGDLDGVFDAGVCIEVVEHLTPTMLRGLAEQLAAKSRPDSIYLFNTGLPEYVEREDPAYLDPFGRGHVFIYSLQGIRTIFEPLGFRVSAIGGKTWAYVVEFEPTSEPAPMTDRIWSALPENKAVLNDPRTGSLMYVLGLDTARAY